MKRLVVLAVVLVLVAAGVVIGVAVSGRSVSQGVAAWEYRAVQVERSIFGGERVEIGSAGGRAVKAALDGEPMVIETINALGAEGWEMVGFQIQEGSGSRWTEMVFKRPVR